MDFTITFRGIFIGSERENQQFGLQGGNFGNTIRMGKGKASSSVDAFIYIRNSTESFCQTGTGGLRVDMPTYMAVANMNDADCIFGESGTHLTEMFKDGSQQSDAVNNFVPTSFAESLREGYLYSDRIIRPVHFP